MLSDRQCVCEEGKERKSEGRRRVNMRMRRRKRGRREKGLKR